MQHAILGAGITGLSAGFSNGFEIYEAKSIPGGICASYYASRENGRSYSPADDESYRFEIGGGHWIFGADGAVLEFIQRLSPVRHYRRESAVYFPNWDLYVPYPLQNHLSFLPRDLAQKALDEILQADHTKDVSVMADWLQLHFGDTLCELFFLPFHELYTAGLHKAIEPQDKYKTPIDKDQIVKGFEGKTLPVGYNAVFVYPTNGLDQLMRGMAEHCSISYGKEIVDIDTQRRRVFFEDGSDREYETLISTLPLNKALELSKVDVGEAEPPHTSVLVVNIGAKRGDKCPDHHWLYIPQSRAGFHRVGFYSNVDDSFLPRSSRGANDRVSIYVEKAYPQRSSPTSEEVETLCQDIARELQEWEFIGETEVVDPTWIEVAYTWSYPDSHWREKAVAALKQKGIHQIGRYGLWLFQGIAKSIKDGLELAHAK